jgi:ganglioside GM2 activator
VPCIDNIGSCTYDGICGDWAQICPQYFQQYGIPCTCPFPAKSYSIPDVTFSVSQTIPGIASGEYRLTGSLVTSTDVHVVCLQAIVDLA